MKILTKEEEAAHLSATYRGGTLGGITGLVVGVGGVALASRRYHFVRSLTLPLKAFLVTSSGTFAGIIAADHASRAFQEARNPANLALSEERARESARASEGLTFTQRAMAWGKAERYKIVGASWVLSMATAWTLVNRNKYLTAPQKLVQARVYAQFLTLGVLVASAAFELSDRKNEEGKFWETVQHVDPKDPEGKRMITEERRKEGEAGGTDGDQLWKEMVAAEEERLKEKDEREAELRAQAAKKHAKKGNKKAHEEGEDDDEGNGEEKNSSNGSKGKKEKDKKDKK